MSLDQIVALALLVFLVAYVVFGLLAIEDCEWAEKVIVVVSACIAGALFVFMTFELLSIIVGR